MSRSDQADDRHPALMLVASGQQWLARSLESIISAHGYQVLRAHDRRQALERARSAEPDLIVMDAELLESDGLDLCRALRAEPRISRATPILVAIPGTPGREERIEALRAGAWDVLGLPLDAEELELKLAAFVQAKEEVDEARAEGLLDLATGLYNVRGLLTRARELVADAQRYSRPLAFIVVALGPAAARPARDAAAGNGAPGWVDQLARTLSSGLRLADALGRFGEMEFVVIAPHTGPEGAHQLANRLLTVARPFVESSPEPQELSVRIGYYAIPDVAAEPGEPAELLARAVLALRRAQESNTEICSFGDVG